MKLEDTYNIHKKINCIFPFFTSKHLCRKNIHCFLLKTEIRRTPHGYIDKTRLKCSCCGREEPLDE